jgi:hypothetical protein
MTGELLKKPIESDPFEPFDMHLADGRVLRVDHPELIYYLDGMRTCIVADVKDKTYDIVDLLLVTSLKVLESRRNRRSKKR